MQKQLPIINDGDSIVPYKKAMEANMKKFGKILVAVLMLATLVGACFAFTACNNDGKVKIGAQQGTTGLFYLQGNADMNFSGYSNIEAKSYDSIGQAVQDMKNGNINYVVGDVAPAKEAANKIGGVKVIDIPLSTEQYAIGVDKNQPELLASINTALAEMKANGKLAEILANYDNPDYVPTGIPAGTYDSSKQQLVMATNAEFAPFESKAGQNFIGIDIEIAKYIADYLGQELVILDMDFDAVVTSVGKNGVDIALAGLTVTESRKVSVTFSDTYYDGSYQVIIVKDGDTTFDECTTKEDVEKILKAF